MYNYFKNLTIAYIQLKFGFKYFLKYIFAKEFKIILIKYYFFILTRFNIYYESMRESIYCCRRRACVTPAFFVLALCFVLSTINTLNARTL